MSVPWYVRLKLQLMFFWYRRHFWFAHYPDCRQFSRLMMRMGKWRVCLGCFVFWNGFGFISLSLGFFLHQGQVSCLRTWFAVALAIVFFSCAENFFPLPRLPHYFLRFSGGGSFALFLLWACLPPASLLKIFMLVAAFFSFRWMSILRRSKMIDPCYSCSHYSPGEICPGFAERMQAERDYRDNANCYLDSIITRLLAKNESTHDN